MRFGKRFEDRVVVPLASHVLEPTLSFLVLHGKHAQVLLEVNGTVITMRYRCHRAEQNRSSCSYLHGLLVALDEVVIVVVAYDLSLLEAVVLETIKGALLERDARRVNARREYRRYICPWIPENRLQKPATKTYQ